MLKKHASRQERKTSKVSLIIFLVKLKYRAFKNFFLHASEMFILYKKEIVWSTLNLLERQIWLTSEQFGEGHQPLYSRNRR